ncbi:MAG: hypothetical protein QXM68_01720 [Candidatus Aenigmatarchaeota archaeon]|nr:hypothetical protein [Candidatus Aenigmarchaeota archaeon]
MKKILWVLFFLNIVAAQPAQDYVNAVIVPSIVLFVFVFGIISLLKFPRIISLLASAALTTVAFILGFVKTFSSVTLSLGGLASTGIYIGMFLLGAMLISRQSPSANKKMVRYSDARKMSRKQISQEMSNIEKKIVQMQSKLESVKIQEHNLELKFSTSKSHEIAKELERIRKIKNELSDAIDMMIERKEYYKKAYREATA